MEVTVTMQHQDLERPADGLSEELGTMRQEHHTGKVKSEEMGEASARS